LGWISPLAAENILMKIQRLEDVTSLPPFPENPTPEELKEAYALARAAFTAADLQKFTEIHEDVPFEQVIAEMEELDRQAEQSAP
jgi:hypothetical protein